MKGKNIEKVILEKTGREFKELLIEMYWDKGLSQRKIAKELGISTGCVCVKFKEYELDKRNFGYWKVGVPPSEEHLKALVKINKGKKRTPEQRKKISDAKKGKKSPRKNSGLYKEIQDKYEMELGEYLRNLYWTQNMSQKDICDHLGIASGYMSRLFKRFDIEKRPMGYWNINSGKVIGTVKIGLDSHNITGRWKKGGYIMLVIKTHPKSSESGCIFEHRVVMEQHLGRYLNNDEIIHHKNEIKDDNRIENLQITNNAEHIVIHCTGVKRNENTKRKISQKAKERLKNKKVHPSYKDIDEELKEMVKKGYKAKNIAEQLLVCKSTVLNKIKYLGLEEMYKNAQ